MMKPVNSRMVWIAAAMMALGILACGGASGSGDVEVIATDPPPPTAAPEPTSPPPTEEPATDDSGGGEIGNAGIGSGTASLEVINEASYAMCFLYVAPPDDPEWGPNQLAEGSQIAAGDSFTLTDIPEGTYDVKVNDCENALFNVLFGADITGEMTWTLREASLEIINDSSRDFCEINISSSSASDWGVNQLDEGEVLAPGATESFQLAEALWDLRAVPCDTSVEPVVQLEAEIEGDITWTLFDE